MSDKLNDLLFMLDELIKRYEDMPDAFKHMGVSHVDLLQVLYVLKAYIQETNGEN